MSLKDVPFGSLEKFNVIIEISQGSQDKYEYDEELDVIKLDRVLFSAQRFPANYGFIPETRADDGDHTDVLLFSTNPIPAGVVVEARAIGFMHMEDSGEIDNKILAVPTEDPRFAHVKSLAELPEHSPKEIKNFFETYKILQDKQVNVGEFENADKALAYIEQTRSAYQS
ncbi:MAG TPA: inorganic diphosphatase [Candidatus Doudnabacteria bacterium]|nr:inorganic diphosphatase [Candidatus Doudnabacteria bacterium]